MEKALTNHNHVQQFECGPTVDAVGVPMQLTGLDSPDERQWYPTQIQPKTGW